MKALHADTKEHEETEERRLAYVALTRARHRLVVSSYVWGSVIKPFGPSTYQETVRAVAAGWGGQPIAWLETPEAGTPNPLRQQPPEFAWPVTEQAAEARRREEAALLVTEEAGTDRRADVGLDEPDRELVAEWDAAIVQLLAEAREQRRDHVAVRMPPSLSASALLRLSADPEAFTRELARPMPRPPSRAARFGTLFHAWVEDRFKQQPLLDPDDLPGRADLDIADESDLDSVIAAFERGPFADRVPHAVEAPFALVLDGQVVRGRIDAVYEEPDGGFLVVDWKTSRQATADPLQLAIYRLAWAELTGMPPERVRAAFYYVRTDEVVSPPELPGRAELERLLDLSP
jgi:DNA helicase-2/ATP-dependent DNA helicase PcrA